MLSGRKTVKHVLTWVSLLSSSGGSEAEVQRVRIGQSCEQPADTVREGFVFGGWYQVISADPETLADTEYDFDSAVNESITMKAVRLKEVSVPSFSGHQLILSGSLGLKFGVKFSESFGSTGSYVTFTVSGTAGGEFTLSVSALSYVRSVLNSDKYKDDAKNKVTALYKYYESVKAYR